MDKLFLILICEKGSSFLRYDLFDKGLRAK